MNYDTLYNKLNDRFFDSELPNAHIMEFDGTDTARLGLFFHVDAVVVPDGRNWIIGIDHSISKKQKITALIHEMIHIWQWENRLVMNHGKTFKRKSQDILEEI